jgi:ABC-type branched-subunit amino acid transport system substrate-binding protein
LHPKPTLPFHEYLLRISLICLFLLGGLAYHAHADFPVGISETEIRIGQSCALTGPVMGLGTAMRDGARLYFAYINSQGGIHGRKINLITLDDGYNPETCKTNTETLIRKEKVFLLFGYVGTPTTQAALPLLRETGTPLFAPVTGAEMFRNPVSREVFNIRASYFQETEAMVDRLIHDRQLRRIAVFYQNDAYGEDGLNGVRRATAKYGLSPVATVSYDRTQPEMNTALALLMKENPDAVILVGSTEPCAQLISGMRAAGSEALFLNVSVVNGDHLARQLANDGVGVVVTQVVPFPFYKRIPVVAEYNRLAAELSPDTEPSFAGMEGFMAAKALCRVLEESPPTLTREDFIQTAQTQTDTDIGGFTFSFSQDLRQGGNLVYLTQIGPGGFLRPLENLGQLYPFFRN